MFCMMIVQCSKNLLYLSSFLDGLDFQLLSIDGAVIKLNYLTHADDGSNIYICLDSHFHKYIIMNIEPCRF